MALKLLAIFVIGICLNLIVAEVVTYWPYAYNGYEFLIFENPNKVSFSTNGYGGVVMTYDYAWPSSYGYAGYGYAWPSSYVYGGYPYAYNNWKTFNAI